MNSLEGPSLAQVFPPHLYKEVIANLTNVNGTLGVHLRNVPVLRNDYLGVTPYTLDHLFIVSNQPAEAFMTGFSDPNVVKHLGKHWPNSIPVGMSTTEANTMCAFNSWKVWQHEDSLREILTP